LFSVELTSGVLAQADCVVLTTNHDAFDVAFIRQHARLIVDLRNMIRERSEKVYKL
jgi:UDP-N-acetyl-D-glucosamine dehydrogenase